MSLSKRELSEIQLVQRRTERRRADEAISQNLPNLPTVEQDGLPILPDAVHSALTAQQRAAIAYLIGGRSYTSTAMLLGVDRRTLYEWRRQPAFARTVDELSREALLAVATRARNLLLRATYRLERSLDADNPFEQALRITNSKRVWEMANVTPNLSEDADGTPPEGTPAEPARATESGVV